MNRCPENRPDQPRHGLQTSDADIHRDPGKIGDFLLQTGQPVEQHAFTRIRAADQYDFTHEVL